jgi:hypothetical protein
MENNGVPAGLRKLLTIRMTEENWPNIRAFCRGTNVPFSLETVRRAFNECPYKNLDTITLAIIMKHLNYSPKEIKTILTEHLSVEDRVTKTVLELIGDGDVRELNSPEKNLIELYRKLITADPGLSNKLADLLDMLAKGTKVKASQYTAALRR